MADSAALTEVLNESALKHLLRVDHQEDLCFALWTLSQGITRRTALLHTLILPNDGERRVHGNASFTSEYFTRALGIAIQRRSGLALLHSHVGPGWQGLSHDDHRAEGSNAPAVQAATALPFVGLTVGTDGSWSARFWDRVGPRLYEPSWASAVRIVGQQLQATFHPELAAVPPPGLQLSRSIGVWGREGQAKIARLTLGIVGLGSVGSIVCEALARMGVTRLILIDYDRIQIINLDRTLGADHHDIGRLKVDVAADNALRGSTAKRLRVDRCASSIVENDGYRAALDCDVIFSCVDRPWARRILNHIAFAHLIPVIDGGILVRVRGEAFIGADWHVRTSGPGRRCLECWKAFDPSLVGIERDGLLDDPTYLAQLDKDHILLRHENVFPFSLHVASLQVLQLQALLLGPVHNIGDQNYHAATGTMDRTEDSGCEDHCPYPGLTATSDTVVYPGGKDIGAAKVRENLHRHEPEVFLK
ncbi:MAG: hypothetical protein DMG13_34850 [Acidobacteria bacterium]|nr:MAG: hypothetical protein DMG13_34850 [Acidobacteriota bacterium]